jgi:hypothetical protein
MNGIAGWQSTHRGMSELDLRFREMAKDSPEFLERAQFQGLDESSVLLHYRLQAWPTFLGAAKLAELKRVSVEVSRLLRTVPERILGNDPRRVADFYGLASPAFAEILLTPPTGTETMLARGDLIETAGGFRCIEFNFTPNLGGWDTTIITERQLAAPPTARFVESEGLRIAFTDTMGEMFRYVVEDLRRKGIIRQGEVTIAFLAFPEEVDHVAAGLDYFNRELRRTIARMGLDLGGRVLACSGAQLAVRGSRLLLDDRRVDAVVEINGRSPAAIYRLFKGDLIGLYNGPMGPICSNKRTLALLSQHADTAGYSPEERAFVAAHLPWTRLVTPGEVEYEGEAHALVELLLARRERFVLKDGDSFGGSGVVLGKFATPEHWRETLDRALVEKDWVAQEILESLPYLYQSGEYGCSVHDMIWGPFVFGARYGGVVLRMQPQAVGGAVNLSLTASEGIVFEV